MALKRSSTLSASGSGASSWFRCSIRSAISDSCCRQCVNRRDSVLRWHQSRLAFDRLAKTLVEVDSLHHLACVLYEFTIIPKNDASDPLALPGLQSLTACDALSELDGFFSGPVLIHNRNDHTTEIIEVEFATLARHDLDASVSQQSPVDHHFEVVLAGHATLFGQQYRLKFSDFCVLQQAFELWTTCRCRSCEPMVFVPCNDVVPMPL